MTKPCFFYNRGCCRNGDNCAFLHDSTARSNTPLQSRIAPDPNLQPSLHHARALEALKSTPNGTLVLNVTSVTNRASDGLILPAQMKDYASSINLLRKLSRDNIPIKSAPQAEQLVSLLLQSNVNNTQWNRRQGQALLVEVCKDSATIIERLTELLTFLTVSCNASTPRVLSFQKVYMGIIGWLTSAAVLQSAATSTTDSLYMVVHNNLETIIRTLTANIVSCVNHKTFADRADGAQGAGGAAPIVSGTQVFKPVVILFIEYLNRFQPEPEARKILRTFAETLQNLLYKWEDATDDDAFYDAINDEYDSNLMFDAIDKDLDTLIAMTRVLIQGATKAVSHKGKASTGPQAAMEREYNGPGKLSRFGPRHSNDHPHIAQIAIPPTSDELTADREPYVPFNLPNAPHHLENPTAKMLDVQFRLLRSDMLNGFCAGVDQVTVDMASPNIKKTELFKCLREGGGWYNVEMDRESIRLPIMTDIRFTGLSMDDKFGLVIQVSAEAPPGPARSPKVGTRYFHWKEGKRLPHGGLVALVTKSIDDEEQPYVAVAVLTMMPQFFKHTPVEDPSPRVAFGLHFLDQKDSIRAVRIFRSGESPDFDTRVLIECPVLYESARPFLKALQSANPFELPFSRYLVSDDLANKRMKLPAYSKPDEFEWNLASLLRPDYSNKVCSFDPCEEKQIKDARRRLRKYGNLDPSDAVIDALTRELALIQGPPGTGKTFTGVELLRVLLANEVGPVLLLAYTNQALDHILRAVHSAGVTDKIARLGSRCKDDVVAKFMISNRFKKSTYTKALTEMRQEGVNLGKSLKDLAASMTAASPSAEQTKEYVGKYCPDFLHVINNPPRHVKAMFKQLQLDAVEGWQIAGSDGNCSHSLWDYWASCSDISALELLRHLWDEQLASGAGSNGLSLDKLDPELVVLFEKEDIDADSVEPSNGHQLDPLLAHALYDPHLFLKVFKLKELPQVSTSSRSVDLLLEQGDVWDYSAEERTLVVRYMEGQVNRMTDQDSNLIPRLKRLSAAYKEIRATWDEAKENDRISMLKDTQLIGATTNGAAKFSGLIKGIAPSVLLIEEAGQVLEAHILSVLYPSIKHVIAIGDPFQLRPNINTYNYSVDSQHGRQFYNFDLSLMERLSTGGLPMSQLQVQRRMAPNISSLVRNTLYPKLEDSEVVTKHPPVAGMVKSLFFLDHRNREKGGGESGCSKVNVFEADMACELALYLLKQGCYSKEGDIVILCTYLGQLMAVRQRLRGKVHVVIGESEQEEIAKLGAHQEPDAATTTREVKVDQQVLLRTVDNFQGEEASVVILSLVRNAGSTEDGSDATGSIGFLKTNNRTNVAISRARHGMYLLGNAQQLASHSPMWDTIIKDLTEQGAIGTALQVACSLHGEVLSVDKPGVLSSFAPDGGCTRPCGELIPKCGHPCPKRCHPDDRAHEHVFCEVMIHRLLQDCGHSATVQCGRVEFSDYHCEEPCGEMLDCCDRPCAAQCHACQAETELAMVDSDPSSDSDLGSGSDSSTGCGSDCDDSECCCETSTDGNSFTPRTSHAPHACSGHIEICNHPCSAGCGTQHDHTLAKCTGTCLRTCCHKTCKKGCGVPCSPCSNQCEWTCEHVARSCELECGTPCERPPCDEPCEKLLSCGHPCSSVCGEPCDIQLCIECGDYDGGQLAHPLEGITLDELLQYESQPPLLTLDCGHTLSVLALDAALKLDHFYTRDESRTWNGVCRFPSFTPIPRCPTCKAPVHAPRYGRLFKRAVDDLQRQASLSRLQSNLDSLAAATGSLSCDPANTKIIVDKVLSGIVPNRPRPVDYMVLLKINSQQDEGELCTPPKWFECLSPTKTIGNKVIYLPGTYGVEGTPVGLQWRSVVSEHLAVYERFATIINDPATRAPRTVAVDDQGSASPGSTSRSPPPLAESCVLDPSMFTIAALHDTIWIRLQMVTIAVSMTETLWEGRNITGKGSANDEARSFQTSQRVAKSFKLMAMALLVSCERDIAIALKLPSPMPRMRLWLNLLALHVAFTSTQCVTQWRLRSVRPLDRPKASQDLRLYALKRRETAEIAFTAGMRKTDVPETELLVKQECFALLSDWAKYASTIGGSVVFKPRSTCEPILGTVLGDLKGDTGVFTCCPNGHPNPSVKSGKTTRNSLCSECGLNIVL